MVLTCLNTSAELLIKLVASNLCMQAELHVGNAWPSQGKSLFPQERVEWEVPGDQCCSMVSGKSHRCCTMSAIQFLRKEFFKERKILKIRNRKEKRKKKRKEKENKKRKELRNFQFGAIISSKIIYLLNIFRGTAKIHITENLNILFLRRKFVVFWGVSVKEFFRGQVNKLGWPFVLKYKKNFGCKYIINFF